MKNAIVAVIFLQMNCNQVAQSGDTKKAEGQADQTLGQLTKRLKKQGWEEVSIPPLPDPCEGAVVKNELLDGVKQNQKVTFTYHWVVIKTVRVPPNTEQQVILGFEAGDEKEGNVELVDARGLTVGETVSKKNGDPARARPMELA